MKHYGERRNEMRIDLLAKWLKDFPYGYCDGINFQTCRTNKNIDCPYCVSNVHCSDGIAAINYYREMLWYMRLKPRQARKRTLMFAETLPSIMRSLDRELAELNKFPQTETTVDVIDAVSVVRCKDCKHYNTIGCSKGFGWCENIDRGTSDNFYCANGKQLNKESEVK
jgi:hypothetical protein